MPGSKAGPGGLPTCCDHDLLRRQLPRCCLAGALRAQGPRNAWQVGEGGAGRRGNGLGDGMWVDLTPSGPPSKVREQAVSGERAASNIAARAPVIALLPT